MLEHHGVGMLEFNQNSVPFDFDGEALLWMAYLPGGVRELYLYNFATKERETVLRFAGNQGVISHCKLAGGSG